MSEAAVTARLLRARLVASAKREADFRERVYPKRVVAGRMSQAEADDEIAAMRQIVRELEGSRP
jgi:hypothetical protein